MFPTGILDVKTLKFGKMYLLGNPDTARLAPARSKEPNTRRRESAVGLAVFSAKLPRKIFVHS